MKFKVGQKYEVVFKDISEHGNIIEIIGFTPFGAVKYKTIKGRNGGYESTFDAKSGFANNLRKVKSETIVIYRKGKETIALDKTTGTKAVAKCSPDDTYSFYTGAEIAIKRLLGIPVSNPAPEHPNCRCSMVREVKRAAKVGEYVKVVNAGYVPSTNGKPDYKNGDILKIVGLEDFGTKARYAEQEKDGYGDFMKVLCLDEYVVLENYQPEEQPQEKEFKPHLISSALDGVHYGNIGELTALRDIVGRPLKVGDTVELYTDENELRGERAVVFESKKAFIMGIAYACKENGTIKDGWKIVKKRDYTEVANGEIVDGIKYIKEEPKPEPQLYNGKVVCVDNTGNLNSYTVGKVYEFKDGLLTNNYGAKVPDTPALRRVHNFKEWQSWTSGKFIELVE